MWPSDDRKRSIQLVCSAGLRLQQRKSRTGTLHYPMRTCQAFRGFVTAQTFPKQAPDTKSSLARAQDTKAFVQECTDDGTCCLLRCAAADEITASCNEHVHRWDYDNKLSWAGFSLLPVCSRPLISPEAQLLSSCIGPLWVDETICRDLCKHPAAAVDALCRRLRIAVAGETF